MSCDQPSLEVNMHPNEHRCYVKLTMTPLSDELSEIVLQLVHGGLVSPSYHMIGRSGHGSLVLLQHVPFDSSLSVVQYVQ